ncbi:uncharacterized mitochondrial protein AtMg00810-like [Nymphaea colorata]|uniref:uncharacterized mitochondrial protein AtMg00810-like n=1 Tax=Nymphaea colorata TaxID=210225 RepID=UPI00129D23B2|nr:uncharacterized mitochondrial protein AtMg00810-like [Nymphaea colorata]
MKSEIKALEENNAWSLTLCPAGATLIDCKWVFKAKYRVDGSVEGKKAWLVAKGYAHVKGNSQEQLNQLKEYLNSIFHMKDLCELKYFLGIELSRSKQGIYLCQREETGCIGVRPIQIPMGQQKYIGTEDGELLEDPAMYGQLVGRLIYLTVT